MASPPKHRAGQRADAAEHGGGECLDPGDKAHEEIDETVIEQVHHARDRGECGADHEGHGDGAVDVDAEQRRHGLILLAGAHVAAEPGARYQPGEQREQHDGGDDHHDLDIGQLHHEAASALMQRIAAPDDRRHRLDARALGDLRIIGQHERHADGRQHRRQAERMAQRPVGDALHGPAIERGDRHRHQQHDEQDQWDRGQAERDQDQKRDQRDEAADHENIAMGEIDHADDAIDHGVADGDQAIDRAEHEAVDELLGEIIHALPLEPIRFGFEQALVLVLTRFLRETGTYFARTRYVRERRGEGPRQPYSTRRVIF